MIKASPGPCPICGAEHHTCTPAASSSPSRPGVRINRRTVAVIPQFPARDRAAQAMEVPAMADRVTVFGEGPAGKPDGGDIEPVVVQNHPLVDPPVKAARAAAAPADEAPAEADEKPAEKKAPTKRRSAASNKARKAG